MDSGTSGLPIHGRESLLKSVVDKVAIPRPCVRRARFKE